METVVNAEPELEGNMVSKTSSADESPQLIADPIVYQLVRVEGDGRLVPATGEEVYEVEDLLDDGKSTHSLADTNATVECTTANNKCSSNTSHFEGSQCLLQSGNLKAGSESSRAVLESEVYLMTSNTVTEDIVHSLAPSTADCQIHQSASGQCSNPPDEVIENDSVTKSVSSMSGPDFSKLKGEICLNNLSVRELHEIFRATFGRVTSNKDKQWLKRRISMGLTRSFDVSTTTFLIEDDKVVRKGKEEMSTRADVKHAKDPPIRVMNEICEASSSVQEKALENHLNGSGKITQNANVVYNHNKEDISAEQRAVKRLRKPTRRYIEEVSEGESRESNGKLTSKLTVSTHGQSSPRPCIQNIRSDGRPFVTRQDSLGGSGIQIPYVSRIRRCRPRENFMTLMKLQPSEMGSATRVVRKAFEPCDSQPDTEEENKTIEARSSPGSVQQPLITKPKKAEEYIEGETTEFDKDEGQLHQHTNLSDDNSHDGAATVPIPNGGMRRKHHRPWTLSEVVKLVDGVARYGAGRWSEIKKVSFASYSYRTSVDLKDKWRNLLRASFTQLPADKGADTSRKQASIPIPTPILVRVRELAEMQGQVPPNLSGGKFAGHSGRVVHERRSGYL